MVVVVIVIVMHPLLPCRSLSPAFKPSAVVTDDDIGQWPGPGKRVPSLTPERRLAQAMCGRPGRIRRGHKSTRDLQPFHVVGKGPLPVGLGRLDPRQTVRGHRPGAMARPSCALLIGDHAGLKLRAAKRIIDRSASGIQCLRHAGDPSPARKFFDLRIAGEVVRVIPPAYGQPDRPRVRVIRVLPAAPFGTGVEGRQGWGIGNGCIRRTWAPLDSRAGRAAAIAQGATMPDCAAQGATAGFGPARREASG